MAPVLRPLVGNLSEQAPRVCCDDCFCRHSLQCPLRVKPAEFYEDHSKQMDDEYVQIFLWQNQVAHLPDVEYEPVGKHSVGKVFPVVGRVVKGIISSVQPSRPSSVRS